jgi:hypothetical protein
MAWGTYNVRCESRCARPPRAGELLSRITRSALLYTYGRGTALRAKIQIQECLLDFDWWEACIMIGDVHVHALEGHVVRLEHDDAHVEMCVPDTSETAPNKSSSKLCWLIEPREGNVT